MKKGGDWILGLGVRAAIYIRQSLALAATADQQEAVLRQTAAEKGWQVVAVHTDREIAGPGKQRPARLGYHALCHAVRSGKVDVVAVATVPAIGIMDDLRGFAGLLSASGVKLHVADDPEGGAALIAATGVLKSAERGERRERARAGQEKARREGRHIGRPRIADEIVEKVRAAVAAGGGIRPMARRFGIGPASVVRIVAGGQSSRSADGTQKLISFTE